MSCDPTFAIEARGLSKSYRIYAQPQDRLKQLLFGRWRRFYREFPAVRNVDLEIRRGETVGIVGRNGSGKSTLLRMLCGIVEPSAGSFLVRGHVAPILSLGVGFNVDFTGRENVRMNAAILGMPDQQLAACMDDIAAFADIGEFFDQPVRSYSSGMTSRLAFAVAIHAEPDILVVDEILAVGDEAFARKCFARIESLKARGSTILFVSHASNLVAQLCDRVLLLEAGERVLTGDPKSVLAAYHRLLHAAPRERADVLAEIRALDAGEAPPPRASTARAVSAAPASGSFDPQLRTLTRVEYQSLGARIRNPRLLDPQGRPINVLQAGARCVYAYEVEFDEPAFGVRFGMMVKLMTGFEIGGQVSHPWAKGIEYVEAGSVVRVRFPLEARLVPDAYFLNAGVLGLRDGGETYLHRILDAVLFRVDPQPASPVTGQVDLRAGDAPVEVEVVPPTGPSPRVAQGRPAG